jgi:PAS domain S-box-containing protein
MPPPISPSDQELVASICASPISTVVTDARAADNPIVAVNSAFERLTGYDASEVIGRNCRFLAGPETDPDDTAMLREAVRSARPVLTELVNYRRDGSRFRNAVMIAPFFDVEGELRFFVGSQMDVTQSSEMITDSRRRYAQTAVSQLTPRQRQVLREMALGYRNKQIAARVGISEKTVKMHRSALLQKLKAMSSTDAVRIAVEAGL